VNKGRKLILKQVFPFILLIGGIAGTVASGVLIAEKITLLKNPGGPLLCDLNPIVACGPVINTPQASAFGFPNPLIGLVGFSVVTTVGFALLAGATFKRWFWLGLQAGTLFGIGFVTWLQYQSIFNIGALCPYCMVVWSVTIPTFWYTTVYNLREGHIRVPAKLRRVSEFLQRHHGDVLLAWFLILAGIILHRFWYYWQTLV
jgi:uncharacterized membrane protein